MLLSIIIVSYNTKSLTLATIKSVIATTKNSKLLKNNLEIIVVDNDSKDDSVAALKTFKKTTQTPLIILENKENLGFGKANNLGITHAKGKYYLFLNSDTIITGSALENMVSKFATDETLGILSPVLLNLDTTYQPQGGSFPSLTALFFHMSMLDDLPLIGSYFPSTQHTGKSTRISLETLEHQTQPIQVDWVAGTALMIPANIVAQIGAFDPNIFMYGEDIELCMRARNHHYSVALDPSARIIHIQNASSTSENAVRGEYLGYIYIFSKHRSAIACAIAKMILQMGAILRIIVFSTLAPNPEKRELYKTILGNIS